MKRRFLALALALVMVVGLLPTYVFTASAEVLKPMDVLVAQNGITMDGILNDTDWYQFYNLTYTGEAAENQPSGTLGVLWDGLKLYVGVTYKNADTFAMTVNGHAVSVSLADPAAPAVSIDGAPVQGVAVGTAGVLEMAIPVAALGCTESSVDQTASLENVALTGNELSAALAGTFDGLNLTAKYHGYINAFDGSAPVVYDQEYCTTTKANFKGTTLTFAEKMADGTYITPSERWLGVNHNPKRSVNTADELHLALTVKIDEMPTTGTPGMTSGGGDGWTNSLYFLGNVANKNGRNWGIYNGTDNHLHMITKQYNGTEEVDVNFLLGKDVGEHFRLYIYWTPATEAGYYDMYVYVDGELVQTVTNSGTAKTSSNFRFGYRHKVQDNTIGGQVAISDLTYTFSGHTENVDDRYLVQTTVANHTCNCIDDDDCTTDILCSVCAALVEEGAESHTEGTAASCVSLATCATCGKAYGKTTDHTPDEEEEGKCSVCGTETGYIVLDTKDEEDNYTVISKGATSSGMFPTVTKYGISVDTTIATAITSSDSIKSHYSTVLMDVFTTKDVAQHISQTITINKMPVFERATMSNLFTGNGYYNNIRRDHNQPETEKNSSAMYNILPISIDGNVSLYLYVYYPNGSSAAEKWPNYPLNRGLGDTFRLTTVWNTDGSLTFYCDGEFVATVANATSEGVNTNSSHNSALTMGYSSYLTIADSYGDGAVDMSVSNIVISNGHKENDDGDCTTDNECTICGEVTTPATGGHTPDADDGYCATPVMCSNPGCTKALTEGHQLTHYDRVAPTNTEDGKKEYWHCAEDNRFFLNAEGTSEVQESELTIPKLIQIDGDKAEVSTESVNNAINGGGENVALDVPTSKVELPADALDALEDANKDLVITGKDGVKVTVNPDALAQINIDSDGSALSIEVKAGAGLNAGQTAALNGYGTLKNVVSATMFAGANPITNFGEGTVTIEIPFEMDAGTTAADYKLYYVPTEGKPQEVTTAVFADGKMTAVLDHFSEYAIVSTVAAVGEDNKATINTNGGSSVATVTGTYVEGAEAGDVFSVDVTWGNLSFSYMAANSWDPETHTHTGGGWVADVTGNVTVVNHSNIAITVTVTKVDVIGTNDLGVDFVGIDGDVATDTLIAGTTENTGDAADKFVVEFKPRGTLEKGEEGVTLATITVRVTKHDENQN